MASFDERVMLATDSLAWGWSWIHEIFYEREWPANLERWPLLLNMNYLVDFDQFEPALEDAFASGLHRHHALDDAEANRRGWVAAGGDILSEVENAKT